MAPIIVADKLSKSYEIRHGQDYYFSLRDQLMTVLRRPVAYAQTKVKTLRRGREVFWALTDASFSVEAGEVVGIIGANGAGKSTLLKVLNRIVTPTSGTATINGRISSLLEVGTGFHPELTGRENIFFSGAVLGMKRNEIIRKFDQIVAFAEMEQFLDMPVKKYSSGMHVRLAFSVAAHMEPDILLIDEVLAVGDASFQKKCLAKIHDAARQEGRTIFFVSHNLSAVQGLCQRTLVLEKGRITFDGATQEAIDYYMAQQAVEGGAAVVTFPETEDDFAQLTQVSVRNHDGVATTDLEVGRPISIAVEYTVKQPKSVFWISAAMIDENNNIVWTSHDVDKQPDLMPGRSPGQYETILTLPFDQRLAVNKGRYTIQVQIAQNPKQAAVFNVSLTDTAKHFAVRPGALLLGRSWEQRGISPQ